MNDFTTDFPTDIDDRLRRLGGDHRPPRTPTNELRGRADRRRARRQRGSVVLGGVAAVVLLVGAVGLAQRGGDATTDVAVGPGPTADAPAASSSPSSSTAPSPPPTSLNALPALSPTAPWPGQRNLGGLTGVRVEAAPSFGLVDGSEVRVSIGGFDVLAGGSDLVVALCPADVGEEPAASTCDVDAASITGDGPVTEENDVVVRRTLFPGSDRAYDCAAEPVGCAIGVVRAGSDPLVGVVAAIAFRPEPPPAGAPALVLSKAAGLSDGEPLDVTVSGLEPGSMVGVGWCTATARCDVGYGAPGYPVLPVAADGTLSTTAQVWSSIYELGRGVVDCTTEPCQVMVFDDGGYPVARASVSFAAGVEPSTPMLTIDEPGPFTDRQVVTVRGTGFRPGVAARGPIGQCPADKDTAREERCQYSSLGQLVVGDDGTFAVQITLTVRAGAEQVDCAAPTPGCHLGWVLTNGTTIAKLPVAFAP